MSSLIPDKDTQARQDTTAILEELLERKSSSFANIRRYIIDFELRETRDDIHLSVVSSPEPEGKQ